MEKKPNLILLNGPLGIGKSTLAKYYAEQNPLSLAIDIDELRFTIGQFRERPEESSEMAFAMAVEIGRVALLRGHDVVVAQILRQASQFELFEELAEETNAKLTEVLLHTPKDQAMERFVKRGQANGLPLGYKPDGLIGRNGGLARVEQMYDEMMELAEVRPQTQILESTEGEIEETYSKLLNYIEEDESQNDGN